MILAGQASVSPNSRSGPIGPSTRKARAAVSVESPNGKTVVLVSSANQNNAKTGPTSRNQVKHYTT